MSEVQVEIPTVEVEVSAELKNIIEALIFASDEPMSVRFIRSMMDEANKELPPDQQIVVNAEIVRKAVSELNRGYGRMGSAFRIIEIAGGFVHATQEQFAVWVGKLAKERARRRLSPTAIETLAIIAYKQPITKTEVEFIRGVNADYIITALLEKDLIHITGRQNTPGRPLLYGTTQKFLEHFGLNELADLPKPREIAELINETEMEVDRRLLAEQQELEFRESLDGKLEGHEGGTKAAQVEGMGNVVKGRGKTDERSKGKGVGSKKLEERDQKSEVGDQRSEIRGQTSEDASVQRNVEADAETKTGEASTVGTIGEHAIEEKIETPIEGEERVEVTAEVNAEPVVPFQQETKNINEGISSVVVPDESGTQDKVFDEGAELSAQRVNIKEEPDQRAVGSIDAGRSSQEDGRENGWSKWKTKVKTFFKKLFG